MHGDMTQQARERALQRFEDKHVGVLIATDVAARGLDLDDITLVVNYDPPQDDKGYVHRVGRTARAGRSGMSVTFVTPDQLGDVSRMAARLDLHEEFELEGMKVAPPRTVFSGSTAAGRRSGLSKPGAGARAGRARRRPGGSRTDGASRGCPRPAPAARSGSPGPACSPGRRGTPLLLGLDPLGERGHPEVVRERDHRAHHAAGVAVPVDVADERTVDLQDVDRHVLRAARATSTRCRSRRSRASGHGRAARAGSATCGRGRSSRSTR